AERLADRLLAREPRRVVLRRIRLRVAVRALGVGEAALAETRVALEGTRDPRDLDQVDADSHRPKLYVAVSIQPGSAAIEVMIPSGWTRATSTVSGRNLPVRTSTVFRPQACAPAMSASMSSPTIQVSSASESSASSAAWKYAGLGFPSTVASIWSAYSRPATKAPESSSGPRAVCHQRFLCRQ